MQSSTLVFFLETEVHPSFITAISKFPSNIKIEIIAKQQQSVFDSLPRFISIRIEEYDLHTCLDKYEDVMNTFVFLLNNTLIFLPETFFSICSLLMQKQNHIATFIDHAQSNSSYVLDEISCSGGRHWLGGQFIPSCTSFACLLSVLKEDKDLFNLFSNTLAYIQSVQATKNRKLFFPIPSLSKFKQDTFGINWKQFEDSFVQK